ncbi:hypothetical protein [Pelagibius marinus]|uniref:hypothetical protein n=1 Tax=Pelagibius marinus TaxID=2762760 RepID=UPI001872FBED|nr:hypothetical protein [Pelagibius marinus]
MRQPASTVARRGGVALQARGCRDVRDPGAGGLNTQRIPPRCPYRLPASALQARVSAVDRDLLLQLPHGGLLLLRDLITVEAMADPPVFEVGARDLLASLAAVLALAEGGGAPLWSLYSRSPSPSPPPKRDLGPVIAALRRDGILPEAESPEWDLL